MRDPDPPKRWRIGDLAAATGLTVRALRHYEQRGLLAPAHRTTGRQRLYGEADVQRLYRVLALRALGLSLDQIAAQLDGEGPPLDALLAEHLARVEAEIRRLTALRARLRGLVGAAADADGLIGVIDAMSRVQRRVDHRRGAAPTDAEAHWRALGDDLRACMSDGPASPAAQAVARRIRDSIRAFAGGDRATMDALATLRAADQAAGLAGWDAALVRFLDRALAALDPRKDDP